MLKRRWPAAPVSAALFLSALTLCAADVWVAKPYTAWSDKDIRKIMTDSPWSRSVSVTLYVIPDGTLLRGRGLAPAPDGPGIAETGGGLGVGGPQGGPSPPPVQGGPPKTTVIVRWQSATVVQQALVKAQYGDKAGSSPEAQKRLEPNAAYYIIAVGNLPASQKLRDAEVRKALLGMTTLTVNGKDHPITARDVVYVEAGEGMIEARFLFPREVVLTADDKEVEFATMFGKAAVKAKFNLRNMAINGKLGL
ncbi:MAG TPA: hypothetical protein VIY49_05385 [Bryobacteraceae bacterium]